MGNVVGRFYLDGQLRYNVRHVSGFVHIFNPNQIAILDMGRFDKQVYEHERRWQKWRDSTEQLLARTRSYAEYVKGFEAK